MHVQCTFLEAGDGRVVLKLEKGPLQHVLWIYLLHPQQVEHHVIRQSEGTVQWVRMALREREREGGREGGREGE